jgi:serine/threonine protein kinase
VGTLRYIAPERFQGFADARSDVYALGVTLYEMLILEPTLAADERPGLIEALSRSNALDQKSARGFNAYFLAMAHRRRGAAGPARKWFVVAWSWHRRAAPVDPELGRFRAEAESLLGLEARVDRVGEYAPAADANLARLVLRADPSAAWARTWLENSKVSFDRPAPPTADADMPVGPDAFARP